MVFFKKFLGNVTDDSKEKLEEVQRVKHCPNCDSIIPQEADICPYCGSRCINNGKKCPNCNYTIPQEADICPYCGSQCINNGKKCPNCDNTIPQEADICPYCAYILKDETNEK